MFSFENDWGFSITRSVRERLVSQRCPRLSRLTRFTISLPVGNWKSGRDISRVRNSPLVALVVHQGNQSSSREEADQIRDLVTEILAGGTTWIDHEGVEAQVGLEEILIIAPYNYRCSSFRSVFQAPASGPGTSFRDGRDPS